MTQPYDAIIIGAGHNGLVTAAYLGRAGKRVLVLERRHLVGGAAVTEEIFPGFKFSVFSYVVSLLRPDIIRELDLASHGLQILPLESTLTPLPNGDHFMAWGDHDRARQELQRHVPSDAEAYDNHSDDLTVEQVLDAFAQDFRERGAKLDIPADPLGDRYLHAIQMNFVELVPIDRGQRTHRHPNQYRGNRRGQTLSARRRGWPRAAQH